MRTRLTTCILMVLFIVITHCNNDSPNQTESPKGVFVEKIALTNWDISLPNTPLIMIADLYNDNGIFRLYNRTELTEGLHPIFSRDKLWIVYVDPVNNGTSLMIIRSDGTLKREIPFPDSIVVENNSLSPDGQKLVFDYHNLNKDYGILGVGTISIDGSNFKSVHYEYGWSFLPCWSADGSQIYFSWLDMDNRFGHNLPNTSRKKSYIVKINPDGSGFQVVSDTVSGISHDRYPAVSPDGTQIAFSSQRNHSDRIVSEIFVMNIDGTNVRQLSFIEPDDKRVGGQYERCIFHGNPIWTTDGQYILFNQDIVIYHADINDYEALQDIYIVSVNGGEAQNITNNGFSSLTKH